MKTLFVVFLMLVVILLGLDEKFIRSKLLESRNNLSDAQDQINTLQDQINQLKAQLRGTPVAVSSVPPALTATQMVADYSDALAIVEGKNAVGSGFICAMEGHTYIFTNAHVLCDNPELKITSIKGTSFTIQGSAIAVGHDVVRMEVTGAKVAFAPVANFENEVKIGDPIVILGNPEGEGVVKPLQGRIVGVGPNLVEVDAPFVKGNSGSPIIHLATGKVVGVATYITERKMDTGSVSVSVRRFGYRLDSIKQWEPINWQAFYEQSAQLTAIETLSDDFVKMLHAGVSFEPDSYASPALQRSIRTFEESIQEGGKAMSIADKKTRVEQFVFDLRSISHSDIVSFNKNTAYDYFRREVEDQAQFRDDLYQGLTKDLENLR